MGLGAGVLLLAAGAILSWAVDVDLPYLDDDALGAILLTAGVVILAVSAVVAAARAHDRSDVGTGLVMVAVGAVLCWALDVDVPYIWDQALGAILIVGGVVATTATVVMHRQQGRRTTRVVERRP